MATRAQLIEANKKAVLSPLIGKHGKRKATLEKEARRKIFEEEVTQIFEGLILKARPEYLLDQYLGKAPEELNINTKTIKINLSADITAKLKEELKQQLLDGDK